MSKFELENLDVFQLALDAAVQADAVAQALPRGRAYLADQIRRAVSSVVLNIAEGAGEWLRPEKEKFYRYAKRSAVETGAAIVLVEKLQLASLDLTGPVRSLLLKLIPMMMGLIRHCGPEIFERRPGEASGQRA
ncbi:MAG: four helix bundle protein [Planctomycetota bacterium]